MMENQEQAKTKDSKPALKVVQEQQDPQPGAQPGPAPVPPQFTPAELSVCYRAVMELPMKRSDPAFAAADSLLRKIGLFAQAQAAAQAAAQG
jgi:hypothetical protein